MGQALDKVTQDLGLNKSPARGDTQDKTEPTLEEIIDQLESAETKADVKEALRVQLRIRLAGMKSRLRELEANVQRGGTVTNNAGNGTGEKGKRWSVIGGKPIEDDDGEYETFNQAYKVAALEVQAAAASNADKNSPTALFNLLRDMGVLGGKTDSFTQSLATRYLDNVDHQLKAANESKSRNPAEVETLMTEVSSLKEELKRLSDPIELMGRAKALTDSMKAAGIIPGAVNPGEPIELTKLKLAHEEKMEELKTDKEHKEKTDALLAELPERISAGIAGQMQESAEEETTSAALTTSTKMEYRKCQSINPETGKDEGCGFDIPVPPGALQIQCPNPKCKLIYGREEKK